MTSQLASTMKVVFTAGFAALIASAGLAQTAEERRTQGDRAVRALNGGKSQPALEGLRREFPFLADSIEGFALGEVWNRPGLDHRTRQLVAVAAFAARGDRTFLKIHAGYALNVGVTEDELKEVAYLTLVPGGFPRAIEAAQTLAELFQERRQVSSTNSQQTENSMAQHPYAGMWVTQDGRIRHELLANGRYDEQRGNRKSAYQGRYKVTGTHIDYWDDTGFTADGDFRDGVLYHGGMIFYREAPTR